MDLDNEYFGSIEDKIFLNVKIIMLINYVIYLMKTLRIQIIN